MRNLRKARERYGLTQSELAERLGTTQQTIARWESGKAEPSVAALRDLAVCLCTTVDRLLGRKAVIEDQTINPVARYCGDKSGYWGNLGIRLPYNTFSTWYPITTATMERIFSELQRVEIEGWLTFQTLNNRLVICRPSLAWTVTFLDEAEDQVEGDWEVEPGEVEGWPQEIYESLEYLMWGKLGAPAEESEFSKTLLATANDLIEQHKLDEEKLMRMCVKTSITHTDGTTRWLYVSPEHVASTTYYFDLGIENSGSRMLHLDDQCGDHSVFMSLDLISRIEFPLLALKKGLESEQSKVE